MSALGEDAIRRLRASPAAVPAIAHPRCHRDHHAARPLAQPQRYVRRSIGCMWPRDRHCRARIGLAPTAWAAICTSARLPGARVSVAVGLVASLISILVGVSYGAIAGYLGGRTDHLMMRIIEILSGLPLIFFVIFLTVIFGRSESLLFISIGAVGWLTMARIVRGQTLEHPSARIHCRGGCLGRRPGPHHRKTRGPQCHRAGYRVCHADRAADHSVREFSEFLGLGYSRTWRELGHPHCRGRRRNGGGSMDAFSTRQPLGGHAAHA